MDRTYNSVGSNIFFEFGKQKEIVFQNGRKRPQKEWSIWLSWTSWRISQYDKYVVGSGESLEVNIQTHLEKLLGKRILSFRFISQFLDLEINFEDGYQVITFFNYIEEDQWLLFPPNDIKVIIDCSSEKAIRSIQYLSKQIEIKDKYKKLEVSFLDEEVKEILFGENKLLKIVFTEKFSIGVGLSAWRFEKNDQYQLGRKDYYFRSEEGQRKALENKLLDLTGKKVKRVSIDSSQMDLKLEFEGEYSLEIFAHAQVDQWEICKDNEVILRANIDK